MKKIIILDFESGITYVFEYDEKDEIENGFSTYIRSKHNIELIEHNCQWMIVDEVKLKLYTTVTII
jgi:hypothetical protein